MCDLMHLVIVPVVSPSSCIPIIMWLCFCGFVLLLYSQTIDELIPGMMNEVRSAGLQRLRFNTMPYHLSSRMNSTCSTGGRCSHSSSSGPSSAGGQFQTVPNDLGIILEGGNFSCDWSDFCFMYCKLCAILYFELLFSEHTQLCVPPITPECAYWVVCFESIDTRSCTRISYGQSQTGIRVNKHPNV